MKKNIEHGFIPSVDASKEKDQELKKREILEQREALILEQKCFETYKKLISSHGDDMKNFFLSLGKDISKYIEEVAKQVLKKKLGNVSHASNYDYTVAINTAGEWAQEVFRPMTEIELFDHTTYFNRGGNSKGIYIRMAKKDTELGTITNCPGLQPRY